MRSFRSWPGADFTRLAVKNLKVRLLLAIETTNANAHADADKGATRG
jgi:hypothetical protein